MSTNKKSIRLLVADDHNLFRSGLISLLTPEEDILVVAEAHDGKELIETYFSLSPLPDIALVDISMPNLSGIEAAKEILIRDENAKILFLSMYEDDEFIYHCVKSGGKGLINKNILKGELIYAIKQVYEGNEYYKNGITKENIEELSLRRNQPSFNQIVSGREKLSTREEEVLKYISEGLTSSEIAEKLNVSKRTVDAFRVNIIQKLNLKNLPELIKYAIFHNIKP